MTDVKYDAELCERLEREARSCVDHPPQFSTPATRLMPAMADQLAAARAEIERLTDAVRDAVRAVVAAAERKRDERDLLGRDKQCSCFVCQSVDAYRAARGKASKP